MLKRAYLWIQKRKKLRCFRKNAILGADFQTDAHSVCRNTTGSQEAIRIGDHCCIQGKLVVQGSGRIQIGNNCYLSGNVVLGAGERITLGDCVIIARDTHIYDNNNHPVEPERREQMCRSGDYFGPLWSWSQAVHAPVRIDDNVWIGERCSILKGVHIGEGAVVGCCSVVTKDVPPYTLVAGNPAKVVKDLRPGKGAGQ